MIQLTINGQKIEAEEGKTILEAAGEAGIYIPNLCYHPDLSPIGSCRLCVVSVDGMRGFPTSCTTKVSEGMVVTTDSEELNTLRKNNLWLVMSEQPEEPAEGTQLKKVMDYVGVNQCLSDYEYKGGKKQVVIDQPLYIRDLNKCILCGRCVQMCQSKREVGAIGFVGRGIDTVVHTSYNATMRNSGCKFCGGCVEVCPSGALIDKRKLSDAGFETAPPCKSSCPAGIDIPRYVRLIAEERFQDAIEVVRETVPFPETLGTVCEHPCEQACFRADLNEPISICFLKRFVAEQDDHSWLKRMKILPDTGKKVAVVGSGPAGLTVAWNLRRLGHQVTVFECESQAGGMLRMGIPRYRLPASVLDREISEIQQIGVDLRLNTRIENLDALKSEGYDAIFVSTGAPRGLSLGIPGEDHPRVLEGIGWLRGVAFDRSEHLHGHVGIVGGGNVAIDVARTALRMGAEKVTVFYRRTGDEMPAAEEEVSQALVEGVEFSFLVAPKQAKADGESVALELVKMELGEADASGRRRPVPVEGSEHDVKLDYLFAAIGQRPSVPKEYNLDLTKKNTIAVEKPSFCAAEGIFAGGDVVSGPASAISAISQGRRAAAHIDSYLGGAGIIDQVYVNKEKESERIGREGGFVDKVRAHIEHLPKEKRLNNFDQVDFVFSKEQAVEEAKRCLRCQLRYEIKEAPMPPAGCSGSCSMKR